MAVGIDEFAACKADVVEILESRNKLVEPARRHFRIVVEQHDIFAARDDRAVIACADETRGGFVPHDADTSYEFANPQGLVRRAVIDDDDFVRNIGIGELQRAQAIIGDFEFVVRGHDNGDFGIGVFADFKPRILRALVEPLNQFAVQRGNRGHAIYRTGLDLLEPHLIGAEMVACRGCKRRVERRTRMELQYRPRRDLHRHDFVSACKQNHLRQKPQFDRVHAAVEMLVVERHRTAEPAIDDAVNLCRAQRAVYIDTELHAAGRLALELSGEGNTVVFQREARGSRSCVRFP